MLLDFILRRLIRTGRLTVHAADGTVRHYGPDAAPAAGMALRSPAAARRLGRNPALALGELYMEGALEPVDCSLYALLELLVANVWSEETSTLERLLTQSRTLHRQLAQFNPARRARRNVAHHYDLDGRLFSLFLDRDRQYSCAYWRTGEETLEAAQAAKKRHIAAKLKLDRPGLEVLDIGSGWGGMALTLARDWGARVTGITLSEEQLAYSRARAEAEGLADRVRFELMDYRTWRRPVDRVVSVGMFEHVGLPDYRRFFRQVRETLTPDGVALIHAIGRSSGPGLTNAWVLKYIFPGSYCPALSEVLPAIEQSGLWATDIEILRLHYAITLREWRRRFAANRDTIQALYDERFCRMWEFYLALCELAFRRSDHMNWQIQLTREREALPLTRDWMVEAERARERAGPGSA
ncbi:SAM-dependent methyltransferase [Roseicella frigidaeris]|uniref:SAM-dependent methyltransferase n=1 Tax=Roseicella frigidaeris TaxID=2230885 RepID=A0A327ME14_9PROT|nr:cyclopropane-fatty-acyl-phospholipid synthase family protein [Roseicella frigidaeris]RAI60805.1 SAM-dependent methyltransferase [Roseicella frigidaeris]